MNFPELQQQTQLFYETLACKARECQKQQRFAVRAVFGRMKATWGRDKEGPCSQEDRAQIKRLQLSRDKARYRQRKNIMKAHGWDPKCPEIIPSILRSITLGA